MRLVFFGTPEFAIPALRRLASVHDVGLVVSRPDRPSGRRRRLRAPPVVPVAVELGLPVAQPDKPNADDMVNRIRALEPDVLVVAAYGRVIGRGLRTAAPAGAVNLHPSLLPEYRGASPIQAAIYQWRPRTGVTLMQLDRGLDTGPVIAAEPAPLGDDDTAPDVHDRLAALGAGLLIDKLPAWVDGSIDARPQDPSRATVTRPLVREDGLADVRRPAREIYDRWRAFLPWPGTSVTAAGAPIKLTDVAGVAGLDAPPGTVVEADDELLLAAGDAALRVRALQPPGGRSMSAVDFVNGYAALLAEPWGRPYPEPVEPLVRPAGDA